ncbi:MAG TPA: NHL repeat-containing protein [Solirubrobacteraceae bacterium]|jgi:DNA-binding beta-propeller fold protein YncE|nr:NHL repeat-containing protein [Solirubrobacteraceae bacterium]
MRKGLVVAVALCAALAGGLVLAVGAAGAAGVLPFLGSFGGEGAGAGQFKVPRGVAVDNSSDSSAGDVYVADEENQRVEKFGAAGNFILMFGDDVNKDGADVCKAGEECRAGVEGSGAGDFNAPVGVAVDPTSGAVYVTDFSNHRIDKFDAEGKFELMFGGNVNENGTNICKAGEKCQAGETASENEEGEGKFHRWRFSIAGTFIAVGSSGTVYVGDENRVQEFNEQGEYQTQIKLSGFGIPTALAVNVSGDVFLRAHEGSGVHEFDQAGTELHEYESEDGHPEALAVDPVGGDLYVVSGDSNHVIRQYEASAPYSLISESKSGLLEESTGIALGRHGTLYASDTENNSGANKVLIYGSAPTEGLAGAPAPTIGSTYPTPDGSNSADLAAVVNPHFLSGSYYVEYGREASYGSVSATLQLAATTEVPETVLLEGLQPESEYHYRFVVTTNAGTTYGSEETVATFAPAQSSLPDGRVYELVTPPYKNGNTLAPFAKFKFGIGEAGGEAVAFMASGAMGTSTFSTQSEFVSRRTPGVGWSTSQVEPRPTTPVEIYTGPTTLVPSADFKQFVFAGGTSAFTKEDRQGSANIFLAESPLVEPLWLGKPQVDDPVPALGGVSEENYVVAGASPDLGEVYFAYSGTLLPEDREREAHIGDGLSNGGSGEVEPWGFYAWNHGTLEEAGELPGGKLSPFGAIPADLPGGNAGGSSRESDDQADLQDNWLSDEGRRALFVSPDPISTVASDPAFCAGNPKCTSEPPELYLREALPGGGHKVALVSGSALLGHQGEPAVAGVAEGANALGDQSGTFAFASSDGSQVFFASEDFLTKAAEAAGHAGPKEYDYDVETGGLTYLPEVHGSIVSVAPNGSDLMFVETVEPTTGLQELKVWRRATGVATDVAELPSTFVVEGSGLRPGVPARIDRAFVSGDGNVFVSLTNARIPGFNDGGFSCDKAGRCLQPREVFRYDVAEGRLSCLSCGPSGVTPFGDASIGATSRQTEGSTEEWQHENGESGTPETTIEARGMSADGERVFFDTPNQLVAQATNGKRDVYEWEKGHVYLISSGTSSEESYYVDNSESGNDVFFVTSAGLVAQDTDGSADMYDARVPRPGDTAPPSETPCKGAVCQGPPSVPSLLGVPPSETFSGPGNLAAEVKSAVTTKPKVKTTKKKAKRKQGRRSRHRAHGSSRYGKGQVTSGRRGK